MPAAVTTRSLSRSPSPSSSPVTGEKRKTWVETVFGESTKVRSCFDSLGSFICSFTRAPGSKMTLVLDLDETLVHSTFRKGGHYDLKIEVNLESMICDFYVAKRPYVDLFLQQVAEWFEVVIFTASLKNYADPLIDVLDTGHVVSRRLFRESCVERDGNFIKDLSVIGRDLSKVMLVDNSPVAYMLNVDNAVPIESWFDDQRDEELLNLLPMLYGLSFVADARSILSLRNMA